MMNVAERIRAAREQMKASQGEIANVINVDKNTIWRWENGKTAPTVGDMPKLAAALNTTVAYLMSETDAPAPVSNIVSGDVYGNALVQNALVQGVNNGTVDIRNTERTLSGEAAELVRVYELLNVKRRVRLLETAFKLEEEETG